MRKPSKIPSSVTCAKSEPKTYHQHYRNSICTFIKADPQSTEFW